MGILSSLRGMMDKAFDYDAYKSVADQKYRTANSGKKVLKDEYMIGGAKYKPPSDDSDVQAAKNKILSKKRKQVTDQGSW